VELRSDLEIGCASGTIDAAFLAQPGGA